MKSAFIIHDSYTNPDADWYPWLSTELKKLGYAVFSPKFPTPEHQSLKNWLLAFEPYQKHISPESIFIGHGTGALFTLRIIEKLSIPVRSIFLIAPFIEQLDHQGLNLVNATFVGTEFQWKNIHDMMGGARVIMSDDDPYIPVEKSKHVAETLGVLPQILSSHGHMTGNTTFPELLENITAIDIPQISIEESAQQTLNTELELAGIHVPTNMMDQENIPLRPTPTISTNELPPLSPEHTYYQDIATTLNTAETTEMAGILRAEREHEKEMHARKHHLIMNFLYTCVAIILIILGATFLVNSKPDTGPLPADEEVSLAPSYVRVDKQIPFALTASSLFSLQEKIHQLFIDEIPPLRMIYQIIPTDGGNRIASAQKLLQSFEASLPDTLKDSLGKEYLYGRYGGGEPANFLLLTVSSFDQAFQGMRTWEQSLAHDSQDLLDLNPAVIHPTLYDVPWSDIESHNHHIRILRAPTWEKEVHQEEIEHIIPTPLRHTLSENVTSAIKEITDASIVFNTPTDFLRSLKPGDIIIGTPSDARPGFLRMISDFTIEEGHLIITTSPAQATDAIPEAPAGTELKKRITTPGTTEYYYTTTQEVVTYTKGPETTALLYTFLSDTELLITTNEDVIDEIVERLTSSNRSHS